MPHPKKKSPLSLRSKLNWRDTSILTLFLLFLIQAPIKNFIISHYSQPHQLEPYHLESTGQYDTQHTQATWMKSTATSTLIQNINSQDIAQNISHQQILGAQIADKHIEVDLTTQKLYAIEGDQIIHEFPISSGLYDWTPTGTFWIWYKIKYTRMEGGNPQLGTYYNLPNVPYTMFFHNAQIPKSRGYGLHGAYWHNDFGRPKSHGCVNLRPADAETLFYWTQPHTADKSAIFTSEDNPGTMIRIYGKYQY